MPALRRLGLTLFAGSFFILIVSGEAISQEINADLVRDGLVSDDLVGHSYYGKMRIQNDDASVDGGDYEIDIFGLDVQKPLQPRTLQYGYETGAVVSLDSEVRRFRAASGSEGGMVAVSVEINSILVDYFFGGFIGFEPADWLRLYAGAGPLITWGSRETETEATDTEPARRETESGWGAGLYLRAGVDILFSDSFGIQAGTRVTETTLRLKDTSGEVDLEGWQYYLGLVFRF
jgi:opacity protein-like surface antigen